MGLRDRGVQIKTPEQVRAMRRAGLVVGRTLELLRTTIRAGLTTAELDAVAEEHIRSSGATPSFLGYLGFPRSICVSVNDEVVHGIPGERVLADGDVVSIDCGAIVDGWHGDAAVTVPVGEIAPETAELVAVTEEAMWRGIAAARAGGRVTDISHAVESHVREVSDFGLVEEYTGHGIGTAMHMPPNVPNLGRPGRGARLVEGIALAVEPMVTLGHPANRTLEDDWTVVTLDGRPAAHHEHTFALTAGGAWVLTALDGGEEALERLGAPFAPLAD